MCLSKIITMPLKLHLTIGLMLAMAVTSANSLAIASEQSSDNFVIALLGQHKLLNKALADNQFRRPLVLNSTESPDQLKGEIYAVLNYPFTTVNGALNNPAHWCNALILHINVKYCRAISDKAGTVLDINLGKKYDQPLVETYKTTFKYSEVTSAANYFSIELKAADGPLGTHDYRIWVEATPLKNGQTFLHFTYAYSFGLTGRLAMKGYLATIGKDKVGFTIDGKQSNAQPNYIQGVRGVVERNTMRYYLAIDAYLATLKTPPESQLEKSLQVWFDNTEQFSEQLHEVERAEYFEMKRKEIQRQNSL